MIGRRLLRRAAVGAAATGLLGLGLALGLAGGVEGLATGSAHGWTELPALWLRLWPLGLAAGLGWGADRLARTGALVVFELGGVGAPARAAAGAQAALLGALLGLGLLAAGAAEAPGEPAGWVYVEERVVDPARRHAVPAAGGRLGRPQRPPDAARVARAARAAVPETAGWAAAPPGRAPGAATEAAARIGRVLALTALGAWLWGSAGRGGRLAWGAAAAAGLVLAERAGVGLADATGVAALAAAPAALLACTAGLLALRAR